MQQCCETLIFKMYNYLQIKKNKIKQQLLKYTNKYFKYWIANLIASNFKFLDQHSQLHTAQILIDILYMKLLIDNEA